MQASAGRFDKPLMDVVVADVACKHETECGDVQEIGVQSVLLRPLGDGGLRNRSRCFFPVDAQWLNLAREAGSPVGFVVVRLRLLVHVLDGCGSGYDMEIEEMFQEGQQ